MAEIRIERKRRGLGWLWLLLALLIVAVLAWYFLYPGRGAPAPATAPPATGALERRMPETHNSAIAAWPALRVAAQSAIGGCYGQEG
jgi:hypothetical protein